MRTKRVIIFFLLGVVLISIPAAAEVLRQGLVETDAYLLYVPSGLDEEEQYPLVIVFSPTGDAAFMIEVWQGIAEDYKVLVLASKTFSNERNMADTLFPLAESVRALEDEYPIDPAKIITSGFSGGGCAAHIMAMSFPDLISAVITNSGVINRQELTAEWLTDRYPEGKVAAFLVSPADSLTYQEMREDRAFLEEKGWTTEWIEFGSGHAIAPNADYRAAVTFVLEAL